MRNGPAISVVVCVFLAAAFANQLVGAIIGNAKCWQGSCSRLSQKCLGEGGACTWCNDSKHVSMCVPFLDATCESDGNVVCSHQYSGTCLENEELGYACTGSIYVGKECEKPKCLYSPLPGP